MIMPLKAGLRTLDRASTCRIKHGKCMVLRLGKGASARLDYQMVLSCTLCGGQYTKNEP